MADRTPEEEYSLFPRGRGPGRKCALDNPETRSLFLSALALSGELAPAAAAAGITRPVVYAHLKRDPQFAMECDIVVGKLRQAAHETLKMLAVDGIVDKTYDKEGNLISERTRYDTRALMRLIERHDRQWRTGIDIEQKVEVNQKMDISQMSSADKKQLRDILLKAKQITNDGDDE